MQEFVGLDRSTLGAFEGFGWCGARQRSSVGWGQGCLPPDDFVCEHLLYQYTKRVDDRCSFLLFSREPRVRLIS